MFNRQRNSSQFHLLLGTQFSRGFGGFGALLRWRIDDAAALDESLVPIANLKKHVDEVENDEEEYQDYEDIPSNIESSGGGRVVVQDRRYVARNGSNYMDDIEMMFGGAV